MSLDSNYDGSIAIAAGWGRTSENGNLSCVLQKVTVPIMSYVQCRQNTSYDQVSFLMPDSMMCAGYNEGGFDSCSVSSLAGLKQFNSNYAHHFL